MFGFIQYQGFLRCGEDLFFSSVLGLGRTRLQVLSGGDLSVEPYIAAGKATPKEDATGEMWQEIRTALTAGD